MSQYYNLTLKNNSATPWTFYIYQQAPEQPGNEVFSLVWLASPFHMKPDTQINFSWTMDYGFVCGTCESLRPGATFSASDQASGDLNLNNAIELVNWKNKPSLNNPVRGNHPGALTISSHSNVPDKSVAVGMSLSGSATFITATGPNLAHVFTPTPIYWIAAGTEVQAGTVLDISAVKQNAKVVFPTNCHSLSYSLGPDNQWTQQT